MCAECFDCPWQGADTRQECLRVEDNILLSSTAGWVSCPGVLLLPYNGRNFEIKVSDSITSR